MVPQEFSQDGRFPIPPESISRTILGYKMLDLDKALIRGLAEQPEPKVDVVDAHFDPFEQKLTLR